MRLRVIVRQGEDAGFVAQVPALRGCWSQGKSRDEALSNIREAIEGWIEAEQDKVKPAVAPGDVELVVTRG